MFMSLTNAESSRVFLYALEIVIFNILGSSDYLQGLYSSQNGSGNKPWNRDCYNSHSKSSGLSSENYRLSKAEKAQLSAKGKCYKCKQTGHMACNCPDNNSYAK